MKYRSDIDGLRAIAVTLVILFHAGCIFINSGFIGVDVFFVISGYLITKIILGGTNNNEFNLKNFFIRRIWRLQPSFLCAIIFTLIIGSVFYLPEDYNTYLHSVKNALYFSSNKYFADVTTSYASQDSNYLLLLHTWSLSIEWQWYITFPIALHMALKYFPEKRVIITNHIITISLLITSLYLSYHSNIDRYYDFISRCFELQIGSCLAFYKFNEKSNKFTNLFGLIGLLSIISIGFYPGIINGYPNIYTVAIALATGMIIFSGEKTDSISSFVLSSNILVGIGKRSYSLYLWHWPGIALLHYLNLFNNTMMLLLTLLGSCILACISYKYIEMPLRKVQKSLSFTVTILIVIPLLMSVIIYSIAKKTDNFPWRFGSDFSRSSALIDEYKSLSGHRSDCLTDQFDNENNDVLCTFGEISSKKKALFIGDSNSNHYWMFLDVLAKNSNLSITSLSTSSCLTLPGIYQFDWWHFYNTVYQACYDNTKTYYNKIENNKFNYVIIGELWPMYVSDKIINQPEDDRSLELSMKRLDEALRKSLDIIVKSGSVPVIMKEIYTRPEGYETCLKEKVVLRQEYTHGECNSQEWSQSNMGWFDKKFIELQKDYPSLIVIDIKDAQCAGNKCKTEIDGVSIFRDVGHLNDFAAYKLGEIYLRSNGNPFK
ncbi:acyltransferase family protein [Serratia quinivorans]|uniref:acyltransferase family protein n=1 Tax=Serratia quinivorans TaxID=137545 RepID=UPI003F94C21C